MSVGWKFPSTNGGSIDGYNDSGIAHFSGAKFSSLVREIIQNSLDAQDQNLDSKPVRVEFNCRDIDCVKFPGRDELLDIFEKCLEESQRRKNEKPEKFFEKGIDMLKRSKISLLEVADYQTTGLTNDMWEALTKERGGSVKDIYSGGSYGIGKNAPYAISGLRTVFYSTMYEDEDGKKVHKAQGRAVLMSHRSNTKDRAQGTGFYGKKDGFEPIPTNKIPNFLARTEQGTTVCIAGFDKIKNWTDIIAASVIANFFVAIDKGKLEVVIDNDININADSLLSCFNKFSNIDNDSADVLLAKHMYDAMKKGNRCEMQLRSDLGFWTMYILTGDGLPKRVGLVRGTGMMITSDQRLLKVFPATGDFVAICICENQKGNVLLRKMENPQHNAFEPDRLEDEKDIGERALRELAKKIRELIRREVATETNNISSLDEMAEFFPDIDNNESLEEDTPDRNFERGVVITKQKRKKSTSRPPPPPMPPNPPPSPPKPRKSVDLKNIRVVYNESEGIRTVHFTPVDSGNAELEFWMIGDQDSEIVQLSGAFAEQAKNFMLTRGKREKFNIPANSVYGAIRVVAYKLEE